MFEMAMHRIGSEVQPTVIGRDLWRFLHIATPFHSWMRRKVRSYGFEVGTDFTTIDRPNTKRTGRPTREYVLSADMASGLALIERTARGRQARRAIRQHQQNATR